MDHHAHGERSHLFTLRVWPEPVGEGDVEWRGKVQHVITGEQRYFHDWPTLIAFLTGGPASGFSPTAGETASAGDGADRSNAPIPAGGAATHGAG
jgi:hypothetical protein